MKKFIQQFNEKISGVISCFDRMLFKGYLPLGWPGAMEGLLARQGLRIMEFKPFVMKHSERIKTHAKAVAARHDRPFLYLNRRIRKDDFVRKMAEADRFAKKNWPRVLAAFAKRVNPLLSDLLAGKGEVVLDWFPMAKGVANMPRDREVGLAANRRYLDALSTVKHSGDSRQRIRRLAQPVRTKTRSHRALNPARQEDVELMAAVLRGEHTIRGFTNTDIRGHLCREPRDKHEQRRQSQRTGRQLKLLHAHGLIARIPRSRRWRVTVDGWATMTTILIHHHHNYPHTHAAQAA